MNGLNNENVIIMILLGVIIQLIICVLLAVAIALPLSIVVCWRSRKNRKRNTISTFLSPFVFIFTFYLICFTGGFTCSSAFGTGCGMDGYYHTNLPNGYEIETIADYFDQNYFMGTIKKDGVSIVEWVTKIKIVEDLVYGERYDVNEAPGSEYYFILDTKTEGLTQFTSYNNAKESNPMIVSDLSNLEAFYYKSWKWVIPLTILAFVSASGLVLLLWLIVKKLFKL